ncbi:MAG: NADH-quinone oxidoreductase subunit L [Candidatus Tectomicrobia bacterium]|uniref:NADH-ubiquinone oxidoreductase chain 5 n=1 Tax=Tectimicrobiota bacterium TaxID=2528274 RepID=A0A933GLE6_UNCTE|nr:NADH-quinone oxidoreductase subunit L [Candidatus Tectomicrobia bacterium]
MLSLVWLVPIFPMLGVVVNAFFGHKLKKAHVGYVACSAVGVSLAIALSIFFTMLAIPAADRTLSVRLFTWIAAGVFKAELSFLADPLSAIMMLVVTGVGFLIHIYSIGYMHDDPRYSRFFTYLNLFTFFMLILVVADNLLLMFVGWEGVGLCSYLLIGFWFERKSAADAGKKAFVVNRIGDFGFLLAIMLTFTLFGTVQFNEIFAKIPALTKSGELTTALATVITLLLFLGAVGKSAQIPLYVWLPDAMEGPTPVSALIHAATMVTAGVYMVVRTSPLYVLAPFSMEVVATIGALTAIFSASIGLVQNDIKRVMAYSTVSQLGYMFMGAGVGAFSAAIFHLWTHAFFKALLFLGAGSVIHALSGEQDMRNMGGLKKHLSITYGVLLVASLALSGIPPFAGFFSKDEILWEAWSSPHGSWFFWLLGAVAALMTAFYSFRMIFLTFYGEPRMSEEVKHHLHESPPVMTNPLLILAFFSVVAGLLGLPLTQKYNFMHSFLSPVLAHEEVMEAVHGLSAEVTMMMISVVIALAGIAIAAYMYLSRPEVPERLARSFSGVYQLLLNKYYVDEIYEVLFVNSTKKLGTWLWNFWDSTVIDRLGVDGTAQLIQWGSGQLRRIQLGYVRSYAFSIIVGVVFILGYLIFA